MIRRRYIPAITTLRCLAASSVLNCELFRQRSSSGVGNGEENEKARERKGENREKNCESWGKESSQREQEDLRRRWHRCHSGIIYISLNRIYFRKKQMGIESWMMLCIWFRSWAYRRRRLRRRKFTSTKMSLRRRLAPTVPYCSFLLLTYFFFFLINFWVLHMFWFKKFCFNRKTWENEWACFQSPIISKSNKCHSVYWFYFRKQKGLWKNRFDCVTKQAWILLQFDDFVIHGVADDESLERDGADSLWRWILQWQQG